MIRAALRGTIPMTRFGRRCLLSKVPPDKGLANHLQNDSADLLGEDLTSGAGEVHVILGNLVISELRAYQCVEVVDGHGVLFKKARPNRGVGK
jgi:hypothetical protein